MEEKNKYQEALNYFWKFYSEKAIEGSMLFRHYLDDLQELADKATPKDVEYISTVGDSDGYPVYDTAICPACDREFEVECEEHYDYCPNCGQKLKW